MTTVDWTSLLNNGNDDSSSSEHPRRLMKLLPSGDLLAWGGATGSIVCFQPSSISNSDDGTAAAAAVAVAPRLVRPRDDPDDHIRAVAVSHDGTRVALGMDSGSTLVYHCDDDDSIDDATQHHFFCSPSTNNNAPWIGPTFSAGVRDLAFHPACRDVLAVATEEGLCVLRIILGEDDPTTNDAPRFVQCLVERAAEQHQSSGMRSVAFSTPDIGSTTTTTLASLAMDGRVCLWNCNSGSGSGGGNSTTTTTTTSMALSPSDWTCVYRSPTSVVPKKDVGELLGADAWDRSCRPLFFSVLGDDGATSLAVALPGDTTVQVWVYNRPAACWQDSSTTTTAATRSFPSSMEAVAPPPHTDSIVTLAVSGDNRGLTSSGRDGRIVLWKIAKVQPNNTKSNSSSCPAVQLVYQRQLAELESAATDLLWEQNTLYAICANGSLVVLDTGKFSAIPEDTGRESVAKKTNDNISSRDKLDTSAFFDDSDDDRDIVAKNKASGSKGASSSSIGKTDRKKQPMSSNIDFALSDDDELDDAKKSSVASLSSPPPKARSTFIDDEAADEDDIGQSQEKNADIKDDNSLDSLLPTAPNHGDSDDDSAEGDFDFDAMRHPFPPAAFAAPLPERQAVFAPSSSPLDLSRRFLCWNHVGAATLRRGDDRSTVDINFTDYGVRRPITFTDNLGFILGSLGEDGGIFATDLVEDDASNDDPLVNAASGFSEKTREAIKNQLKKQDPNKPLGSTIYFHRFETFGALRDKDWYLTLPSGERALGCATGDGWAAVLTSRRFLRLFSSGGNQGQIFWLDGDPISMVGRSRFLAVFYHIHEPLRDGTQKIGYKLIDTTTSRVLSSGSMSSISNRATLAWAGFSNEMSLLTLDSVGMVSMLVGSDSHHQHSSWEWMPMLDTLGLRKSSDDSFWPVTAYDGKLVCVPLKGGTKYPDATRRPVTSALNFKLPVARGTLAKSAALEEVSIRAGVVLCQKKIVHELLVDGVDEDFDREYYALSAQVDKVTLKMFASIVEAGKLERALDLVERLHLEKSFEIAMKIADRHRKLVDFIENVKERKFGEEYEGDYDNFESPEDTEELGRSRISPDGNSARKRQFENDDDRNVRLKQSTYA